MGLFTSMIKHAFFGAFLFVGAATAGAAEDLDLTCDEIAAAIGAPVNTMKPDPSSEPAWVDNPDDKQLLCAWVTEAAFKAMNGAPLTEAEGKDAGQIIAQVMIYKDPEDLEALRSLSIAHKLPMENASADMWIFDMSKEIDFAAPPILLPPQLIKHDIGVSISTMHLLMTMPVSFETLTKGWSVETSADVIAMIESKR